MNKKNVISATDNVVHKLHVLAKKKEKVRSKLVVTAKQLASTAKGKEDIRKKLAVTAKKLATTAREKESIRSKLAVIAKKLAITAKEKESVRSKLVITAETLRLKAEQLAETAKDKEDIRSKLVVTAKEKEDVRNKLVVTAKKLAVTAKAAESVRGKLAVTAETLRLKAKQLANTAKEKEDVRKKLVTTAKKLATTAKEAENVRQKLALTAKQLKDKATQLAITAKEKESTRRELVMTAKQLAVTAEKMELANKELKSLDLAKDEFVSIASHQLRTPLTALKGYVGMLLDGDAGPINTKQHEYLAEIKNANDRMIGLITALLNVSRVDLGVFIVEPEQVDLKKVAENSLNDLDLKIKEKKLQIKLIFEKDVPTIKADLNIVRMIFQNLFTNAVKYTPPAGQIKINIKKKDTDVLILVSDTGYGIPKNAQSKIFTKMFRADNARVKDPDGTGLGLYIIKSTLEKTGGKIWFESVENKGSTFYVTIPLEGMKKKEGTKRLELKSI